jgi:asparagine synthase (glutamine-hydrolysing)
MCGIIGAFNRENAFSVVKSGLETIKERGRDGCGYFDGEKVVQKKNVDELPRSDSKNIVGHVLHAIVNTVFEPIQEGNAVLAANCEIYNWEELSRTYKLPSENDAAVLLKLINKIGVEKALDEIRGVYAFAYWKGDDIVIARDIIGVKPLWYSVENGFSFCSEKKALAHCKKVEELNPRTILTYNIADNKFTEIRRPFIEGNGSDGENIDEKNNEKNTIKKLKKIISEAIAIRTPDRKFGVLFSGGVDSAIVAKVLKDSKQEFTCYVAGIEKKSADVVEATEAAAVLGLRLKTIVIGSEKVENYLKKVVPLIEDSNVVKVGVALPLYASCEQARKDSCKVIFSGAGADEVFAGYARYKNASPAALNKDCYSDVLKIYEKNTYRDDVVTMHNNLELRVPFLDKEVVEDGLAIAPELKIKKENNGLIEKYILRKVAVELGIPEHIAFRKKKAAQYGSGFDKVIGKLAKKQKKSKSAYLGQFYAPANVKLGALLSSGKDSLYAAYIMKRQNYEIACAITLESENPDSFMFHTPNVHLVKLQAEAMGIPLVRGKTKGQKEVELGDLRKALEAAKEGHGIQGIVSGALYSNYQRERIEKVADDVGLKLFSPLWHMDQEQELRNLLKAGFEVIMVSVAAEGLDKSWLGRTLTQKDVDKLVVLHKKYGINIAGEGGEYESLVLDCPMFQKKLEIEKYHIQQENSSARLLITACNLRMKT